MLVPAQAGPNAPPHARDPGHTCLTSSNGGPPTHHHFIICDDEIRRELLTVDLDELVLIAARSPHLAAPPTKRNPVVHDDLVFELRSAPALLGCSVVLEFELRE